MKMMDLIDKLRGREQQVSAQPVVRMPSMDLSPIDELRNMALAVGLKKMLTAKHFSICDLELLIQAGRIVPDGETMRILRVLHCVDYADMPIPLRKEVVRVVAEMFREAP